MSEGAEHVSFDGRVAIVTGAGGGLGREYALELAGRGAKVVVNDIGGGVHGEKDQSRPADDVVAEVEALGGEAIASNRSVADPESGAAIVADAIDAYGTVDIVINNAGILRDRSFANMSPSEVQEVVEVHLLGAFWVSRPAFAHMKEAGYGRFVFTSSNSGLLGNFGQANYGAAKMGLVGLSNVLAIEGARYGIKSNVIAPVARTRMTEEILGPLGELVDPRFVVPMVLYLSSELCEISHEIYSAAGGRFARFFVGTNAGWMLEDGEPSVEDVAANMDTIRDISDVSVLGSSTEELSLLLAALNR